VTLVFLADRLAQRRAPFGGTISSHPGLVLSNSFSSKVTTLLDLENSHVQSYQTPHSHLSHFQLCLHHPENAASLRGDFDEMITSEVVDSGLGRALPPLSHIISPNRQRMTNSFIGSSS